MNIEVQEVDIHGNPIGKNEKVSLDISKKDIEKEMKIYCDCGYLEEKDPVLQPKYVTKKKIKDVGWVHHHGWVCPKCGKYVQVG